MNNWMDGLWVEKIQSKRISEFTEITQNNTQKEIKNVKRKQKTQKTDTESKYNIQD